MHSIEMVNLVVHYGQVSAFVLTSIYANKTSVQRWTSKRSKITYFKRVSLKTMGVIYGNNNPSQETCRTNACPQSIYLIRKAVPSSLEYWFHYLSTCVVEYRATAMTQKPHVTELGWVLAREVWNEETAFQQHCYASLKWPAGWWTRTGRALEGTRTG